MSYIDKLRKSRLRVKWRQIIVAIFLSSGITSGLFAFLLQKYWYTNRPPTAAIKLNAMQGPAPHTVEFDGAQSSDPEGRLLKYSWLIEGQKVSEKSALMYVFEEVGTYRVQLIVEDPDGAKSTAVIFVESHAPRQAKNIEEALKYYQYKKGWAEPITKEFKFYRLDVVEVKDNGCLTLKYDYKQGTAHYTIFESERQIIGYWIDANGKGKEELTFSKDFKTAEGWWSYDHSPQKKYKVRLQRVN